MTNFNVSDIAINTISKGVVVDKIEIDTSHQEVKNMMGFGEDESPIQMMMVVEKAKEQPSTHAGIVVATTNSLTEGKGKIVTFPWESVEEKQQSADFLNPMQMLRDNHVNAAYHKLHPEDFTNQVFLLWGIKRLGSE